MNLYCILWNDDRIEHIGRHNLTPDEVEEAVFDDAAGIIQKLQAAQRNPDQNVYRFLGCTQAGRYITFIFIYEGKGVV